MKQSNDMKLKFLIVVGCLFGTLLANAQDHIYSQFFNSPVYLNPALNGQFEGDLRMNLIYRNQWSSLPGNLSYLTASIDYNIPRFGGGVGLMFNRSSEGTSYYTKNSVAGIYSYSVGSESFVLSFGLQAGITNRQVDYSKLVFADQIDPRLGYIANSSTLGEAPAYNNRYYFDAGAGVNLVAGNFMIGSALQHINKPDESFTGTPSPLPMRLTAHASYKFNLDRGEIYDESEKSYIIPSVVFYKQSYANTISMGMQYKRRSINAGLWYRTGGQGSPNAVVISLIFDLFINKDTGEKIRFGLSHDASTSKLGYSNTSGTTEGSLSYETTLPHRNETFNRFDGAARCYHFY